LQNIILNRYGLVLPRNVAISHSHFTPAAYSEPIFMVMAIHASLFTEGSGGKFSNHKIRGDEEGPYYWIALAMRDLAAEYGKPVLLINADFHGFIIDLPFSVS
jgi:hypothetical protein